MDGKQSCNGIRQLNLPVPCDTGNGKNFSAPYRKGYILNHFKLILVHNSHIFHPQDFPAEGRLLLRGFKADFTAHHQAGHFLSACFLHIQHIDKTAPVQNRTAVGHLFNLFQLMGN